MNVAKLVSLLGGRVDILIKKYPILLPFIAFCVGLVLCRSYGVELSFGNPALVVIVSLLCLGLILEIFRRSSIILLLSLFVITGYLLVWINYTPFSNSLYDSKISAIIVPKSNLDDQGKWQRVETQLVAFRENDLSGWEECERSVFLNVDSLSYAVQRTENRFEVGDTILVTSFLRSISGGYGRYMEARGVYGQFYLYNWEILSHSDLVGVSSTQQLKDNRQELADRLYEFDTLRSKAASLMAAMTLGDRSRLSSDMVQEYRDSGVAHLLAISGLHVGIVLIFLNLVFSIFKVFGRVGWTIYSILIILMLWGYALFVGAAPSILRAVIMFSLYQVALIFRRDGTSINVLLASAMVILMCNPLMLYDVGFQLSYAAMFGISLFYKPLTSLFTLPSKLLQLFWGVVLLSLSAQIVVLPLVVFYFGDLTISGLLLSVVIFLTVPVVIFSTILYLITGVGFIAEIGLYVSDFQNRLFSRVSEWSWAVVRDIDLSLGTLILIYIVELTLGVYLYHIIEKRLRLRVIRTTQSLKR